MMQTNNEVLARMKALFDAPGLNYAERAQKLTALLDDIRDETRQACAAQCMTLANELAQQLAKPDLDVITALRLQNQMNGAVKCHEVVLNGPRPS